MHNLKPLSFPFRRVLCCVAVGEKPLLHCAWLVARVGVLWCIVAGTNPEPLFSAALGLNYALGFLAGVSVLCASKSG